MKKIQSIETLVSMDYKGNKKGLLCCKDCHSKMYRITKTITNEYVIAKEIFDSVAEDFGENSDLYSVSTIYVAEYLDFQKKFNQYCKEADRMLRKWFNPDSAEFLFDATKIYGVKFQHVSHDYIRFTEFSKEIETMSVDQLLDNLSIFKTRLASENTPMGWKFTQCAGRDEYKNPYCFERGKNSIIFHGCSDDRTYVYFDTSDLVDKIFKEQTSVFENTD